MAGGTSSSWSSSFTTPAIFVVRHGAAELGFVDPISLRANDDPAVLSLGGRSWKVQSVDWPRRTAWVEPAAEKGRSRWLGSSRSLPAKLTRCMKQVLIDGAAGANLSRRARSRLDELRERFGFLTDRATTLVQTPDGAGTWWTFAGGGANAMLSAAISRTTATSAPTSNDLCLQFGRVPELDRESLQREVERARPLTDAHARFAAELKFSSCLPPDLLVRCLNVRLLDRDAASATLAAPISTDRVAAQ